MKPFNIFLILSLIFIFSGFIFLKKEPSKVDSEVMPTQEILFDVANYVDYSDTNFAASRQHGKTLLFFAATKWCQSCSQLEKEILNRAKEIPQNLTILKIDYDNNTAMNTKYAVTSQHTLVLLDNNGDETKRWVGGDFEALLKELESTQL